MSFLQQVEAEKARMLQQLPKPFQKKLPTTFPEALRFAADLVERTEALEMQLRELQNLKYPEVLLSNHIIELMGISKSTLSQWAKEDDFPHLDGGRQKGDTIRVLKSEFFSWLKGRRGGAA
jgi:hypothetical protein